MQNMYDHIVRMFDNDDTSHHTTGFNMKAITCDIQLIHNTNADIRLRIDYKITRAQIEVCVCVSWRSAGCHVAYPRWLCCG